MHTYTDLYLAHPLAFDIVVNSAYALLTMPVTYKPTNVVISPFIRYSGTSAYTVTASFLSHLKNRGWSAAEVYVNDGIIYTWNKPPEELLQWDGLLFATNETNEEEMLYLLETKEIAHINDIRGHHEGLYDRGLRTYKFVEELK